MSRPRIVTAPLPKSAAPLTSAEYGSLQYAFDNLNRDLFGGQLPQTLITLNRHPKARGYFKAESFHSRKVTDAVTHEIALNPDTFEDRTDEEILSTLAHEMCHLWQQEFGTPPRRCYHDREWAAKMEEIGLCPSDTAAPGGKRTGQHVSHYIIEGGAFAEVIKHELAGVSLNWQSQAPTGAAAKTRKAKAASKTKYSCPECQQNAWAKPGANLICGDCEVRMDEA